MSKPLSLYLGRITPWQSGFPNYTATVSATLQPITDAAAVVQSIPYAYDLDTAVGAQLDSTGQWIGPTRNVALPIPGTDFTWSDPNRGWNRGLWHGPYSQQYGITQLDDGTYRRLLYAVVLANHWDGTIPGAQSIFNTFFIDPTTLVFIQDNANDVAPPTAFAWATSGRGWTQTNWRGDQYDGNLDAFVNCGMSVCIAGTIPPPVYLGLLAQNALTIKPGGVTVDYRITSVNGAPVFGWGVSNQYVGGWGAGAWGVSPGYLLNHT